MYMYICMCIVMIAKSISYKSNFAFTLILRGVVAAVESRASLDRRRLEDAHLKLAVLQIISWYPESLHIQDIPLTSDVNAVLARFTGIYYNQFTAKYAGKIPTYQHVRTCTYLHIICWKLLRNSLVTDKLVTTTRQDTCMADPTYTCYCLGLLCNPVCPTHLHRPQMWYTRMSLCLSDRW